MRPERRRTGPEVTTSQARLNVDITSTDPPILSACTDTRPDAVRAARRGWAVFPVRPGDKRPACDRWEERACADPELVARHWPGPRHNIGIACGPSGLVVIDIDPGGVDAFGGLARFNSLPRTYATSTPRGHHLYYAAIPGREIRNSAATVAPHVDVRGAGGYVVGVGSVVEGRAYRVADGRDPAPLPGWLADLADPPRPDVTREDMRLPAHPDRYAEAALRGEVERILSAKVGRRNDALNMAAYSLGKLAAGGVLDCAEVIATLIRAADSCGLVAEDGLRRCERTIESGLTAGMAKPRARVIA